MTRDRACWLPGTKWWTIICFLDHKNINPWTDCDCVKMWRCCWMSMSATMTLSKWNKHKSEVNLHTQNINKWNAMKCYTPHSFLFTEIFVFRSKSISIDFQWQDLRSDLIERESPKPWHIFCNTTQWLFVKCLTEQIKIVRIVSTPASTFTFTDNNIYYYERHVLISACIPSSYR